MRMKALNSKREFDMPSNKGVSSVELQIRKEIDRNGCRERRWYQFGSVIFRSV